MPPIPACRDLGPWCHALSVVLRVGQLDDGPGSDDHEATWLLGHTERIRFGRLWQEGRNLYVRAVLRVPCRYWRRLPEGEARCTAHGFRGKMARTQEGLSQARQLGGDEFEYVQDGTLVRGLLPETATRRSLPVLATGNPCVGAPCRTGDHQRGAACCRDLQVEILCSRRAHHLESLVRSRQSPFLCKITREKEDALAAEMISACAYLGDDGVACALHGRRRPGGSPAKPDLCTAWPEPEDPMHPGCVFDRVRSEKFRVPARSTAPRTLAADPAR